MGLAIEIGALADQLKHDPEGAEWIREDLAAIAEVLKKHGHTPHEEPETLPEIRREAVLSFPYTFLHYLRRAYALHLLGRPLTPTEGEDLSPADEAMVDNLTGEMKSHLLCHSDAEGYYVPVDFPTPIADDAVSGGFVGSSQQLLAELLPLAAPLGILLEDGGLPPEEIEKLTDPEINDHALGTERMVWFTLYEAALLSVEHGTAVMFT